MIRLAPHHVFSLAGCGAVPALLLLGLRKTAPKPVVLRSVARPAFLSNTPNRALGKRSRPVVMTRPSLRRMPFL